MSESKQIYPALININRKIKAIEKGRRNKEQGYEFRGIDEVQNELHDIFAEVGVVILPKYQSSVRENRTTSRGTPMIYTLTVYEFEFIAEDGSSVSASIQGEGNDTSDKSRNKSLSAALTYALTTMFLIPTKDQKDGDSETIEIGKHPQPKPQPKADSKPATLPPIPSDKWQKTVQAINDEPSVDKCNTWVRNVLKEYTLTNEQENILADIIDNKNKK